MSTDLARIRRKVDYLLARDDVAFARNVLADWEPDGLREALADEAAPPADRLLNAVAGRRFGQLWFYPEADRHDRLVDESETRWQGDHAKWTCVGESALATTTAILLHAETGAAVLYDSDAWDWDLQDNFVIVRDSLAAFVDEVALDLDYRRLYYQNWTELAVVTHSDDLEFPGIYGDPWYHLVREMRADLFGGQAVSRSRRAELLRRIDEYFSDDEDED
ncbi:hypothetical protein [Glycomyces terrestris]|uniref:Uncharacterized protein n=1 Tax=Glycomyces terrestris TaxID=2493553 RepID=A0A426V4B9_9ACTN|nr:hypothetical protein [Glycomyces terrestris]RRS01754.1 hypothetical protein EIW28_03070 [Glycomyces terrestris]